MLSALALFAFGVGRPLAVAPPVLVLSPDSHAGPVRDLVFGNHDKEVFSTSADGSLRRHRLASQQAEFLRMPVVGSTDLTGELNGAPTCVSVLPDGTVVAGIGGLKANDGASVAFIKPDVSGFRKVDCFAANGGATGQVVSMAKSRDGQLLLVAGKGKNATLLDSVTRAPRAKNFSVVSGLNLSAADQEAATVSGCAFSSDGKEFALALSYGLDTKSPIGLIRIFDTAKLGPTRDISLPGPALGMYWGKAGEMSAFVNGETGARLFSISNGKATPGMEANAISCSPDGNHLAVAKPDSSVVLCNLSGKVESEWKVAGETISALAISSDNSKIAVGDASGGVDVLEAAGGKPIYANNGKAVPIYRLGWSSSSQLEWSGDAEGTAFRFSFGDGKLSRTDSVASGGTTHGKYKLERSKGMFKLLGPKGDTIEELEGDADWCGDTLVSIQYYGSPPIRSSQLAGSTVVDKDTALAPPGASRVACSPDGKNIAIGFIDGTIRIYGPELGAPKLAFFATPENEWVAFNEQSGLFDCSLRGASLFGFVRYEREDAFATFLPAEQWMGTEYHHPGLAKEVIGAATTPPPPDNEPMRKSAATVPSPIEAVRIDGDGAMQGSDDNSWRVKSNRIDVYYKVKALPRDAKIDVSIGSGKLVSKSAGDSVVPNDPDVYRHGLTLDPGPNYITLTYTAPGGIVSPPVLITVVYDDGKPAHGTFRIFAVGIDQFVWPDLRALKASEDAKAIAESLSSLNVSPESDVAVPVVLKENVTQEQFNKTYADFLATVKSGDRVLVYLSTHGVLERNDKGDEELCFILSDTEKDKALTKGLRWADLRKGLREVQCKSAAVILDACYSGQAASDEDTQESAVRSGGFAVFASSLSSQASAATHKGRGIFTLALLDVLSGKPSGVYPRRSDYNVPSPYITAMSLCDPVQRGMAAYFREEGGAGEIPSPRYNWEAGGMPLIRWAFSSQ